MEKTSSVDILLPMGQVQLSMNPNLIGSNAQQMASNQQGVHMTLLQLNLPTTAGQPCHYTQCLNYLYRIVNHGLIDLFEKHLSRCSIRIYEILIEYLNNYYASVHSTPSSLSSIASESLMSSTNGASASQHQIQLKYFNYYATIRRDIFEFLLRIRSNSNGKVLLVNRLNRRRFKESKCLHLSIRAATQTDRQCEIDFTKILALYETCLDKETDWHVLSGVLADLPYVLQYEMNLIKDTDFTNNVFKLMHKKEIGVLKNRPDNLNKAEYVAKFYALMASLISYHPILDKNLQENILHNFALGINQTRNRYCLEILTIAITEMYDTNSNQCGEILLKLSQFSPAQNMAQPILEFLSTISDFKKLDSVFGRKEFIAVSAIAIKYTDPFKFNPFIILLAHYVICIWFIKCKQDFRKNYVSFTCKVPFYKKKRIY